MAASYGGGATQGIPLSLHALLLGPGTGLQPAGQVGGWTLVGGWSLARWVGGVSLKVSGGLARWVGGVSLKVSGGRASRWVESGLA